MEFSAVRFNFAILATIALLVIGQEARDLPEPISVQWPFAQTTLASSVSGSVTLKVTTIGGRVSDVNVVSAEPPVMAKLIVQTVREWRFEPGPERTFTVDLRHSISNRNPCLDGVVGQVIRAQLPLRLEVISQPTVACDPSARLFVLDKPRAEFRGIVRCDCQPVAAIKGAEIVAMATQRGRNRIVIKAETDENGHFRFVDLPRGEYVVQLSAVGYSPHEYKIQIDPEGTREALDIPLRPQKPISRPDAVVTGGMIPLYPVAARHAGAEGDVTLQLSMRDNKIIEISPRSGNALLTPAAVAAVRTWTVLTEQPVVTVRVRYHLRRENCLDKLTSVILRLPTEVDVEGPCRQ